MEFSENWLREWVDPKISCEKLCDQLTELGIEVETIKNVFNHNLYHGLLIGKILSCKYHPNSKKLNIIKVQISNIKIINIISRNNLNICPGMKVVVAPIGARLSDNKIIKTLNIKGQNSEGKICLLSELNTSYVCTGIVTLPLDAPIGCNIKDYYLFNDTIIKICIGPNRPDCFSIIGLAREISIKNNLQLSQIKYHSVKSIINDKLNIILNEPVICPRYFCRVIKNIDPNFNTPVWIRERLQRSNVTSVNVIIDVMHYVTIEIGVPLHIFNLDEIKDNITLRLSKSTEVIRLSNDVFIKTNNIFVISDVEKVLSIGGYLNTFTTEINNKTRNILIGSAFLNISINDKENIFYGESSYITDYYKRNIDFNKQEYAIEYATNLLLNIIGGQAGPLNYKENEDYFCKLNIITFHRIKLDQIIGFKIDDIIIINILNRLGYKIQEKNKYWQVIVPTWRYDIQIEEDIIGDILRIYGYDKVPTMPLLNDESVNRHEYDIEYLKTIKNILISKGYYEIITYGFVDPVLQKSLFPNIKPLLLLNPISEIMSAMRVSLWPGLLTTLFYNKNRQQENIRLFETGLCFVKDQTQELGIRQDFVISGIASGQIYDKHWDNLDKKIDFYDLKGILESILEVNGKIKDISFKPVNLFCLHPGKSASIFYKEKSIGYIGVLHPFLQKKFKLNDVSIMFEIVWDKNFFYTPFIVQKVSSFPQSKRDISIIVSRNILISDILKICFNTISSNILEVYVFDIYFGDKIGIGKKSVGLRFILENFQKTLEDDEIDKSIKSCILNLKKNFQIILRD